MPSPNYENDGPFRIWIVERNGAQVEEFSAAALDELAWVLNEPGHARIKFKTDDPRALALQLVKREIQVRRDGGIWWWGVPWRLAGDHKELSLECEGLLSYFYKRFITYTSLDYTSLEQRVIAWNLLSHAQTGTDMGLNITAASFTGTTHVRSRRYDRELHQNIYDLLTEFPTLDNGFDYDIVYGPGGLREWTPYHPQKGTVRNDLLLEWGSNIVAYTYSEDAMNIANEVYVTGGASGEVRFEQNYTDTAFAAEYGIMQDIVADGQQQDIAWLLDRAKQEVNERKRPLIIPEVTVINEPVDVLGQAQTGDVLPVRIHHGRTRVSGLYRIQSKTWMPGDRVKLAFSEEV